MADALEARLVDLAGAIAFPEAQADLAASVGARLRGPAGAGALRRGGWWERLGFRSARRGLLLAVAALLLAAAAVAAAGIVLPGLRIVFLPPGSSVAPLTPAPPVTSASPAIVGPIGSPLGLGVLTDLDNATEVTGFDPLLPANLGMPDEVFTLNRQVTLLWRSGRDLPETEGQGVGLLITQFRGDVDPGYYEKQVDSGATTVEPVRVGAEPGYWLEGEPHALVYRDPSGAFVDVTRRVVGDVLIWSRGDLTFRIESALGRDATIALAESMAPAP